MLPRISVDARRTTSSARSGLGLSRFSRRRRRTFSTSTIASSTSVPMAIAMPPSVIVSIVSPSPAKTSAVVSTESGIAASVMRLVRKFQRNRKSTTKTQIAPSRIACTTLSTAVRMKSACRNSRSSRTPPGSAIPPRTASSCRSSALVSTPGCFWIATITAGPPRVVPSSRMRTAPAPIGSAPPMRTSATSRISKGRGSRHATGVFSMSSAFAARPASRIIDERGRAISPPPATAFAFSAASVNCRSETS